MNLSQYRKTSANFSSNYHSFIQINFLCFLFLLNFYNFNLIFNSLMNSCLYPAKCQNQYNQLNTFFFTTCFEAPKLQFELQSTNYKESKSISKVQKSKISLKKAKVLENQSQKTIKPLNQQINTNLLKFTKNQKRNNKIVSQFTDLKKMDGKFQRVQTEKAAFYTNQLKSQIKKEYFLKTAQKIQFNSASKNYYKLPLQQKSFFQQVKKVNCQGNNHFASYNCQKKLVPFNDTYSLIKNTPQHFTNQKSLTNLHYQFNKVSFLYSLQRTIADQGQTPCSSERRIKSLFEIDQENRLSEHQMVKNTDYECKTIDNSQSLKQSTSLKSQQIQYKIQIVLSQIIEAKNEASSLRNSLLNSRKEQIEKTLQRSKDLLKRLNPRHENRHLLASKSAIHDIHLLNPEINEIRDTISVRDEESCTQYSFVLD